VYIDLYMPEFSEQSSATIPNVGGIAKTVAKETARTAIDIGKTILKESVVGSFPELKPVLKPRENNEEIDRVNPTTGETFSIIDRRSEGAIPFSEVLKVKAEQAAHRKSMPPVGAQDRADLGKVRSQLTTLATD
jgi:hypothetical protein